MAERSWETFKAELEEEVEKGRQALRLAESFDEMETIALAISDTLHQKILAAGVAERERQQVGQCRDCGGRLQKKGKKERRLKTSRGEVKVKRERYECVECGRSVFPPGQAFTA